MTEPATTRHSPEGVVLAMACIAQFMVILDVSVVNVALPSIGRDLHYSATGLQWVVNAYVLTFAGFLLLGGRLADLLGRRRVFLFGLLLFSAASLVGGFATTSGWLTAARAVQGLGGAVLAPATLTILVTTFSGAKLVKALGLWSAVGGAGGAVGVFLGGVLTAYLSWRWVLFINVPIGAVTFLLAYFYLGEARRPVTDRHLDIAGSVTVTAGLAILVYGIVGTDVHPWTSAPTLIALAIGVALLAAFFVIELRLARVPLVPFKLFRSRWVSGANVVMFLVGAAFFTMWYFLSLYLQNVLRFGPLKTGVCFLPMTLFIVIGAQTSARLLGRLGVRTLMFAGTGLVTVAFAWLSQLDGTSTYLGSVIGPGCIASFALGLLFTPLASGATTGVDRSEAGLASGVLNTSRQMGGSIGLAVLATVATSHTNSLLHAASAGGTTVDDALTAGYARAFAVAAVLGAVGVIASCIVPARAPAPGTPAEVDAAALGGRERPAADAGIELA